MTLSRGCGNSVPIYEEYDLRRWICKYLNYSLPTTAFKRQWGRYLQCCVFRLFTFNNTLFGGDSIQVHTNRPSTLCMDLIKSWNLQKSVGIVGCIYKTFTDKKTFTFNQNITSTLPFYFLYMGWNNEIRRSKHHN